MRQLPCDSRGRRRRRVDRPDAGRLRRRSYIAGEVPNGPATLTRWIESPRALVPDTAMPDLARLRPTRATWPRTCCRCDDGSMSPASILAPASAEAAAQAEVAWVLIVGAAAIAMLTLGLAALALRRRRRAIPIAWWTIGGGIVFPALVVVPLLVYGIARTPHAGSSAAGDALVVPVVGRMWWWEIRYVDPASGRSIRVANELHVPVGRPVRLALASGDVLHSFWVPELGGKVDMVPGRLHPPQIHGRAGRHVPRPVRRVLRRAAREDGASRRRRITGRVRPLARRSGRRREAADSALLQAGRQAFLDRGCAACHDVRGVSVGSELGPDLSHVGSRLHLGAGVLRNAPGAPAAWITGVQALKPGAHMPAANDIDGATLAALSAYLSSLR
jgi:cytochrome c oxidase subunit 2